MDERQKLQSPTVEDRASAAEALSLMGSEAAYAAVELVNACADEDSVRDWSIAALEELGPPPAESLQSLTKLASASEPLVGYWAITLLGRAGVSAHASEGDLVTVLKTSNELSVRERAAWALGKIGAESEPSILALEQAATSSQARLSRLAKAALEQTQT